MPVRVVGLDGCTRSGKTTLTSRLLQLYQGERICVDHFYKKDLPHLPSHPGKENWECYEGIDYDKLASIIQARKQALAATAGDDVIVLVVEGFVLFGSPAVVDLIDLHVRLVIDEETCFTRRMASTRVPVWYFRDWVWPEHIRYLSHSLSLCPRAIIIDSSKKDNSQFAQLCHIIESGRVQEIDSPALPARILAAERIAYAETADDVSDTTFVPQEDSFRDWERWA